MDMSLSVAEGHLCNMGRMIEEMESKLRNSLDQVLWVLLFRIFKFCSEYFCTDLYVLCRW